jgi:hypothetical protein
MQPWDWGKPKVPWPSLEPLHFALLKRAQPSGSGVPAESFAQTPTLSALV